MALTPSPDSIESSASPTAKNKEDDIVRLLRSLSSNNKNVDKGTIYLELLKLLTAAPDPEDSTGTKRTPLFGSSIRPDLPFVPNRNAVSGKTDKLHGPSLSDVWKYRFKMRGMPSAMLFEIRNSLNVDGRLRLGEMKW